MSTRSIGSRSSGRGAHLDARPRPVLGGGDAHQPGAVGPAQRGGADLEAARAARRAPGGRRALPPSRAGSTLISWMDVSPSPLARASMPSRRASARARAELLGRVDVHEDDARDRRAARSPPSGIASTRTSSKKPVILSRPSRSRAPSGRGTPCRSRRGASPTARRRAAPPRRPRPRAPITRRATVGGEKRHVAGHREGRRRPAPPQPRVDAAQRAAIRKHVGHHGQAEKGVELGGIGHDQDIRRRPRAGRRARAR